MSFFALVFFFFFLCPDVVCLPKRCREVHEILLQCFVGFSISKDGRVVRMISKKIFFLCFDVMLKCTNDIIKNEIGASAAVTTTRYIEILLTPFILMKLGIL